MRNELDQLEPKAGEEEELTDKRNVMMQSEKLFEVLNAALAELNGSKSVVMSLRAAQRTLSRSPLTSTAAYTPIHDALDKAAILKNKNTRIRASCI